MVLPVGSGEQTSVVVFNVRDGKLSGRDTFNMQVEGEDDYDALIGQFIKQYYSMWANVPGEIIVPKPLKEAQLIEQYLSTGEIPDNTCCKFEAITWDNIKEYYPLDNLPWNNIA